MRIRFAQPVELESTARRLRIYDEFKDLNDALVVSKFVNALPLEHDKQQQTLESVWGESRREEVVTAIRARYESSAFKLLLGGKTSASDGALLSRGRTGNAGRSHRGGKARGQRQGGDGGRGGDGGDSDEAGSTASSGSSETPRVRCHVCREITTYRVRDSPYRRCFRCREKTPQSRAS